MHETALKLTQKWVGIECEEFVVVVAGYLPLSCSFMCGMCDTCDVCVCVVLQRSYSGSVVSNAAKYSRFISDQSNRFTLHKPRLQIVESADKVRPSLLLVS